MYTAICYIKSILEPGNHDVTQTTKTTTKTTHKQKQTDRQAGSKTDRNKQVEAKAKPNNSQFQFL